MKFPLSFFDFDGNGAVNGLDAPVPPVVIEMAVIANEVQPLYHVYVHFEIVEIVTDAHEIAAFDTSLLSVVGIHKHERTALMRPCEHVVGYPY